MFTKLTALFHNKSTYLYRILLSPPSIDSSFLISFSSTSLSDLFEFDEFECDYNFEEQDPDLDLDLEELELGSSS